MLCQKTSSSEISFYSEWARKIGKSEINIWKPSTLIVLWLWWAYMETKPCLRRRSPCFRLLLVNWLHVSIHTFTLLAIQDIGKSRMDFICGTAAIQLIHCLFQNRTSKALTMASNQRERCQNFWCSIHGNNWHCCTCNRSSLIMILLFSYGLLTRLSIYGSRLHSICVTLLNIPKGVSLIPQTVPLIVLYSP